MKKEEKWWLIGCRIAYELVTQLMPLCFYRVTSFLSETRHKNKTLNQRLVWHMFDYWKIINEKQQQIQTYFPGNTKRSFYPSLSPLFFYLPSEIKRIHVNARICHRIKIPYALHVQKLIESSLFRLQMFPANRSDRSNDRFQK